MEPVSYWAVEENRLPKVHFQSPGYDQVRPGLRRKEVVNYVECSFTYFAYSHYFQELPLTVSMFRSLQPLSNTNISKLRTVSFRIAKGPRH